MDELSETCPECDGALETTESICPCCGGGPGLRSESIENLDRQAALGEPGTQPGEEPLCRFAEPTG